MSEKTKTVTSKKEVTVEVAFIACYRLVVVPVALVCSVAVAIVQVINMIAVRDGNVAAALAMLVIVASVLMVLGGLALVPVALVLTVDVPLVEVRCDPREGKQRGRSLRRGRGYALRG